MSRRMAEDSVTPWRPVGPAELELIRASGMRAFPPRLPEQPICYPVLTEEYAIKIARSWNVSASGQGFVTRFRISRRFLDKYSVQEAAAANISNIGSPPRILRHLTRRSSGKLR